MKPIYLDHAAATPLDTEVLTAMKPYFTDAFYNPSSLYAAAEKVRKDVDSARAAVAEVLGARPAEIIFTAGGTEANNLAIQGIMARFPGAGVITTEIEHDSVLEACVRYPHKLMEVDKGGLVSAEALKDEIDDRTLLVSVMYANNEIGSVEPIREIGRLIGEIRRDRQERGVELPLYFHTDAAQAANYLDLHVARLGVDLMTVNGGKIYGPKQSGILYVRGGIELTPLVFGGGQERNMRSGTENVPGIIGFAKALQRAEEIKKPEVKRLSELQTYFIGRLAEIIPEAGINGSLKKRLPNNIHLTIPGQDNERMLYQLDEAGVLVATGSACSAASDEPSHVLGAIGLNDDEARASLRLTMGRATTRDDLDRVLEAFGKLFGRR
jgi:cysteine desulfurase